MPSNVESKNAELVHPIERFHDRRQWETIPSVEVAWYERGRREKLSRVSLGAEDCSVRWNPKSAVASHRFSVRRPEV